ncbi:MAG: MarR family transcriptional regulator [Myxococcota bacterium]
MPTEQELFGLMVRLVRSVQRKADALHRDDTITPARFFVLASLQTQGPLAQKDIAEQMGATAANVSQLVSALEGLGLVSRRREGTTNFVSLTDAGADVVEDVRPRHAEFMSGVFSALSEEDFQTLHRLLRALEDEL